MGNYQSNSSLAIGNSSTRVEFEDNWFEQGTSRYAYRGTYSGDAAREGKNCVVKLYKEEWCQLLGEYAWKADCRASLKAQEMAQEFNRQHQTNRPITFLNPEITKVESSSAFNFLWFIPIYSNVKGKLPGTTASSAEIIPKGASLAVERFLEGNYIKFLSNSSYVNHETPAFSPSAFSHFTFHQSRGSVMVTDIQGVRHADRYEFTDPAIHSKGQQTGYYGPTDLGVFGMIKFFQNHHCNDICRGFLTPDLSRIPRDAMADVNRILQAIQIRHSSTYTYELGNSGVPLHRINHIHNQVGAHLGVIAE